MDSHQGENYLFPIGAMRSVTAVGHLQYETVNVGYVLETMKNAKNGLNIIFLDACRDNPFTESVRSAGTDQEGLALMATPSGSLIAPSAGRSPV